LKILHVNTHDIQGGAARAAYRLHQALLTAGVDSQMLVQYKSSDDHAVIRLDSGLQKIRAKFSPALDALPLKRYPSRTKTLFSTAWVPLSGTAETINRINPDIVHLHWVNDGMMRIEELAKVNAPIVWSLHDMWAFTGGCHYDEECGAYKTGCGNCKVLRSSKSNDLSKKIFKRKQTVFAPIKNRLTIIGLSQWLKTCAEQSQLFQDTKVINLPNLLNTQTFSPIDKKIARELLKLPQDKKLVLFGAMSATADPRKGFKELSQALDKLPEGIELIVFGSSKPKDKTTFKQQAHYLGYLHDNISLRLLYSAADVMVVPSLQENLSNAIMESLACGTPVVAFAIGGNGDMIDHQQNGYLAQPFDPKDLAHGIEWVLNHPDYHTLSIQARQKVLDQFDAPRVAQQYIATYQTALK
jgi:glycosyltransferase involved in cell wall biosynthesis